MAQGANLDVIIAMEEDAIIMEFAKIDVKMTLNAFKVSVTVQYIMNFSYNLIRITYYDDFQFITTLYGEMKSKYMQCIQFSFVYYR